METRNFKQYLRESNRDIVIFGSGVFGTMIAVYCQKNSIPIVCFCDNNIDVVGTQKKGLIIRSFEEVQSQYKEAIFIISPTEPAPQVAISKQIKNANDSEIYLAYQFMEEVCRSDVQYAEQEKLYKKRVLMTDNEHPDSDIVFVKKLDLSVTEKCSLRCKDCAHFMPYYEKPQHVSKEALFDYIDRIDAIFDVIQSLDLLGGEPLIHHDIYEIIAYAQTKESIENVRVITNGTILPNIDELKKLNPKKLTFAISDYGDLSTKSDMISNMCDTIGIANFCAPMTEWTDSSNMARQHRSIEELRNLYTWCYAGVCYNVTDGKLFHCAFASNTYRLQSIPSKALEYVDLMDTKKSVDALKKEVTDYLYGIEYLKACDYCKGRAIFEVTSIPAAIQTKEVLLYKKYTN